VDSENSPAVEITRRVQILYEKRKDISVDFPPEKGRQGGRVFPTPIRKGFPLQIDFLQSGLFLEEMSSALFTDYRAVDRIIDHSSSLSK